MTAGVSALDAVRAAYDRIALVDRPEVWIFLRAQHDAEREASAIDARAAAGEPLPLAGRVLAVKDNIDVAGLPTTAACPAFAYTPAADAAVVARLRAAGCIVIGKTNLDQFATGLVGTRSPYGAVRDARRPERVSGGSSSGSAVAVALGIADLALGTDTAGSGRVPASFQGIVGLKPTRGLVPTTGVVPACRELDCVSVFAPNVVAASEALAVMVGVDPADPTGRAWPSDAPLAAPPAPRVGIPHAAVLDTLADDVRAAMEVAAHRLNAAGAELVVVDPAPLLDAGALLYGGAFVAQRYAAFGEWAASHADAMDPTVRTIVEGARDVLAHAYVSDAEQLDVLRLAARSLFAGLDALLLPTVAEQPTIDEVNADPIAVNARLGRFTNGCNLLDLCAVAVPVYEGEDGAQVGVSVFAPTFHDHVALHVAAMTTREDSTSLTLATGTPWAPGQFPLVVVGAHLTGLPLNEALTSRGARFVRECRTAASYRLVDLGGTPRRPGLVPVREGGATVSGELWLLPPAHIGSFLATVVPGLSLGPVQLDDGTAPVGFLCDSVAAGGGEDITGHGGWRTYLDHLERAGQS
jgi:allophanate hydrolase